ncbi:MAG: hypothetical protein LBJ47_09960 [Tannerella sp.]|jgi:hypothetical protein|nr:hypothetical protein [Tannerella sp.]
MKKVLFLLSAAMMMLSVSCEGPMGPPGEPGLDLAFHVENVTVRSGEWARVSEGRYATLYECIKDVDVRTEAYERGMVNVYMFQWNDASNSEVQTQLPYWIQHTDGGNTWLEGYNFDFDEGTVAFYVECRNGTNPPECEFRVVVAP